MGVGKLYRLSDNQFITRVNYQFHENSETSWWGELTFTESVPFNASESYIIELEDRRQGKCRLRKRVNRAVSGVPSRYVYQFVGTSAMK